MDTNQCLDIVDVGRTDGGEYDRLGVAAEAVLEQPCEDRVAIRYVVLVATWRRRSAGAAQVGESGYDVDEGEQRLVDVAALLESQAGGARRVGALAARQVDQIHLGHRLARHVLDHLGLRESHREYGVRATRRVVHVGRGCCAVHVALGDELLDVEVVAHDVLRQVLHVHAELGMLAHLQILLRLGRRAEQVAHLLVVDLQVAHFDAIARRRRCRRRRSFACRVCSGAVGARSGLLAALLVYALEESLAYARYEALVAFAARRAHHRVRLAAARLTVGAHARVVAVERVADRGPTEVVVHVLLRDEVGVASVEAPVRRVVDELLEALLERIEARERSC